MAMVSRTEMDAIARESLVTVRELVDEMGLKWGILGICFRNENNYSGEKLFELIDESESISIFPLLVNGSYTVPPESNPVGFTASCFGLATGKIASARRANELDSTILTSREMPESEVCMGRVKACGCVLYPILKDGILCGSVDVIVSGGRGGQDETCSWAVRDVILKHIPGCTTSNPGMEAYLNGLSLDGFI